MILFLLYYFFGIIPTIFFPVYHILGDRAIEEIRFAQKSIFINISVQGATNDIKKCFRYAEWKSQIFHSIFTYSLVALIDEIKPSVAFLLSSKLIFSQSSR